MSVDGPNYSNVLLKTAREDFPAFYLRSNALEKNLMDSLVVVTALIIRTDAPETSTNATRKDMQDLRDAIERAFTELRAKIRGSPTFTALPRIEQSKIERVIFQRRPDRD